ncbi:MAG: hypothetical protein GTO41_22740 [Burkholderiales bacterium]|nr:hypothetical protein [Burkholderiales bacterium]
MIRSRIAYIEGVGLWSEQLPGWEVASSILRGELPPPQQASKRPSPDLLPPNERRRAPDTVAVALEVGSKACAHARRDPSALPSVFTSTHGDLAITNYMCDTLASSPKLISPTRFHNSVHNAAAGYWAIATGSTRPYTAISAERYSFGNGLLEALIQSESNNETVLLVAYDVAAQGPLASIVRSSGRLGCALVLGCQPSPSAKYSLQWKLLADEHVPESVVSTENAALAADNAMAPALPTFEAIARSNGEVVAAVSETTRLELAIAPLTVAPTNLSTVEAAP